MDYFEYGDQAMVISSGRIGEVVDISRNGVTLEFCDEDYTDPDICDYKLKDLKKVNDRSVSAEKVHKFIIGELSFSEITDNTSMLPPHIDTSGSTYKLTVNDLLKGMNVYAVRLGTDAIYQWIDTLRLYKDEIGLVQDISGDIRDKVEDKDILNDAYRLFDDFRWGYDSEEEQKETFCNLQKGLEEWIASGGQTIPYSVMRRIADQFDDDSIDKESEATQKLFKECLDKLCDNKVAWAIRKRGYCYYCGTKI